MKITRIHVGLLSLSLLVPLPAWADGTDNFDDNNKDTAKWGTDTVLGLGTLNEQNQRLEFLCNNPLSDGDTLRPWKLERLPVNSDWTVQLDTFNNTSPTIPGQVTSGGITLLHPTNATSEVYVELYAAPFGSPVNKGFDANLYTDDINVGNFDTGQLAGNEPVRGAVRLEYNSLTQVLTCFYDTNTVDGAQWTELASYGLAGAGGTTANTDWGLATNQQFGVWVYGYSAGMTVSSGQLYLDNFAETGGVAPGADPSPVPVGNFQFGFPTNNPLLTAIASIVGSYTGTTTLAPLRDYAVDAAQDESGKIMLMGSMDGCTTPTGGNQFSAAAGGVTTVNNQPTIMLKGSLAGAKDSVLGQAKGTFSGPLEVIDIGGGSNGVAVNVDISAKAAGVPFTFKETASPVPVTPSHEANLTKNWNLTLAINQTVVNGKTGTVASAQLVLPNGDAISYPARKVKYSTTKGYKISFKKGTNITVIPNRLDKKSSIAITGLTFVPAGNDWTPTGGTITYSFLGQRGTANLLDFTGP